MITVALSWPETLESLERYNAVIGRNAKVVAPKTAHIKDLVAIATGAEVIIGSYIPVQMIDAAQSLKMVQILHAGISASKPGDADLGFPLSRLSERNIIMGNIHGNAEAVAEHALAFLMAQAKRLMPATRAVIEGEWLPFDEHHYGVMIGGSTTTIIGYGHIGRAIAEKLTALGGNVKVVRKHPDSELPLNPKVSFVTNSSLNEVVATSDFVIIAAPLTNSTHKLINETVLRAMKSTAFLINIARAAIVDEGALSEALRKHWIAGYATDVWWIYGYGEGEQQIQNFSHLGYHYNSPSRYGIHKMPNVISTGDRASFTKESLELFIVDALKNVKKFAEDGVPMNRVSLRDLY